MSVNWLKKKLKEANVTNINVVHSATARIPADAKIVICHNGIKKSVIAKAPNAVVLGFNMFLNDPVLTKVVKDLAAGTEIVEH
jgi:mannitol-specific phosphotransferase system IIBC component